MESSQDLVQGLTLAGAFLDEVVLQPESFFNQVTARTSIAGAKVFMNCNPSSPYSPFYQNVLKKLKEKNGTYIHFSMDDNLTLSESVKERYKTMYSGVFYRRYILGEWCVAEGLIYDMFSDEENIVSPEEIPYNKITKWCIGVDYGTANSTVFTLGGRDADGNIWVCKEYYFAGREEARQNNDYEAQKTDMEFTEDMRNFIEENKSITGLGYRDIEIMIDPAAASFKLQLRRFHMKAKNAENSVLDGIRTVASFIGSRRMKISSECTELIKEMHTYSWDPKKGAMGIDAPIKANDHCEDSLRYLTMRLKDKHKVTNVARNVGW